LPVHNVKYRCIPCGLMDKALPSGGRDCGFESRLGLFYKKVMRTHKKRMRSPGIEPGSITWQATIITTRPRTLVEFQG
jgi:hypothetical protein